MNDIKNIMITIGILLCSTMSIAQAQYYYTTTKTFYQSEYTYQCDVVQGSGIVTLYNKDNKLTYIPQIFKLTGKETPLFRDFEDVSDDNWTENKCEQIVNSAFSIIERERVKGYVFGISMYISPDTGKVTEVHFNFATANPFATIPVSVYRKIETELKNSIWYTPTADGKKLNYIYCGWNQKIATP